MYEIAQKSVKRSTRVCIQTFTCLNKKKNPPDAVVRCRSVQLALSITEWPLSCLLIALTFYQTAGEHRAQRENRFQRHKIWELTSPKPHGWVNAGQVTEPEAALTHCWSQTLSTSHWDLRLRLLHNLHLLSLCTQTSPVTTQRCLVLSLYCCP